MLSSVSGLHRTKYARSSDFLVGCFLGSVRAQTHEKQDEIHVERCDRLPVVTMKVAGENRRFLLDTGAATILNLKSFTSGESKQIHIYSWSGSAATSAREVFLPQVELGTRRLHDLKLPVIDLSPIGKACGGQIDGILGVDLLDQMGMTIDLKQRVAVPAPAGGTGHGVLRCRLHSRRRKRDGGSRDRFLTLVANRGESTHQLADSGAVDVADVVDISQVQKYFLPTVSQEVLDCLALNRAAFAEFDLVYDGDVLLLSSACLHAHEKPPVELR